MEAPMQRMPLVADYEDWPKELYRRLGFDELGYYVKFVAPHT